jgi:hypothetical protein
VVEGIFSEFDMRGSLIGVRCVAYWGMCIRNMGMASMNLALVSGDNDSLLNQLGEDGAAAVALSLGLLDVLGEDEGEEVSLMILAIILRRKGWSPARNWLSLETAKRMS